MLCENPRVKVIAGGAGVCFLLAFALRCSDSRTVITNPTAPASTPTARDELDPEPGLAAELALLPVYPNWIVNEPGAMQGTDRLGAAFFTNDSPEQVLRFFEARLESSGWAATAPAKSTTSQLKLDGTAATGLSEEFTKPGFRLLVSAGPTSKSPARYQTAIGLVLDRVK